MTDLARIGLLGIALITTVCGSCRRHPVGAPAPAGAPDTVVRGIVRVLGAAPGTVVLLDTAGRRLELIGALAAELASLDGADVEVRGAPRAPVAPLGVGGRAIDVRGYDIESIAGGKPIVGILRSEDGRVTVDSTPILDPPATLRQLIGAKVWVLGERTAEGTLRVVAFGALRSARPTPQATPRR